MINDRYILKNCLFSSETIGELYQASDTKGNKRGGFADVLLHFLPAATFDYTTTKKVYQALTQNDHASDLLPQLGKDKFRRNQTIAGVRILRAQKCDRIGNNAFFVLEAPASWSYNVLKPLLGEPLTSAHRRAVTELRKMKEAGCINNNLEPSFFLVGAEGVLYLLGTALSPDIQALQTNPEHLLEPAEPVKPSGSKPLRLLFLSGLGSIALVGTIGVYATSEKSSINFRPPFLKSAVKLAETNVENTSETIESAKTTVLAKAGITPKPPEPVILVKAETIPETAEPVILAKTETIPETAQPVTLAKAETIPETTGELSKTSTSGATLDSMTAQPVKAAHKKIRWNGMDETLLFEKAEKAQLQGHLQAALYFTRVLKRQGSQHRRFTELTTLIVKDYQDSTNNLLTAGNAHEARVPLRQADRLIREFGLSALTARQEQLQSKVEAESDTNTLADPLAFCRFPAPPGKN